jgi:hypothetical protein
LSFLFLIIMSGLFAKTSLPVCIPWFHKTVISSCLVTIIIVIIIISCHRFSFFSGTSALEPVVNPTTEASSLSL